MHSKISKTIGIMNRLKFFVHKHVLLTLYNSLVLPYLNYSVVTWGGSSSCDRLLILQKRGIRLISGVNFGEHTLTQIFIATIQEVSKTKIFTLASAEQHCSKSV